MVFLSVSFSIVGEWRIAITYSGEHINGSPFPCLVYDSNKVFVHLSEKVVAREESFFSIDTRQAGWGDLNVKVECAHNGCLLPIKVDERGNGTYNLAFVPELPGKYLVSVTFNQQPVPASPFKIYAVEGISVYPEMQYEAEAGNGNDEFALMNKQSYPFKYDVVPAKPDKTVFNIETLDNFKVNQTTFFDIQHNDASFNKDDLSVSIVDQQNQAISHRIVAETVHLFRVHFSVSTIGNYHFKVFLRNTSLIHSFTAKAYDISKILISDIPKRIALGQKCCFQGMQFFYFIITEC